MKTKDNEDLAERAAHDLMHTSAEKKRMPFYADLNEESKFSCPQKHQKTFYTIQVPRKIRETTKDVGGNY